MKNVLVLTDFSHPSLLAVHAGADIVRRSGGQLHVVHVFEKPLSGIALQIEVDNNALRLLHAHIQEALDHVLGMEWLQGIDVLPHLKSDVSVWDVVNQSEFDGIDLVVVGAYGNTGGDTSPTGSVAKKVLQHALKPVLVIKHKLELEKLSHIVFASDFRDEALGAFSPIAAFAGFVGADLHLLKIITPTHFERTCDSEDGMADFATKAGLLAYSPHVFNDLSVERGIETFCATHGASMVAMETHGRTGLGHLIYGSTAEDVLAGIELPMLSTHIFETQTH